jgi:hypothetical protein
LYILCKIWGFHGGDYDDYHLVYSNLQNYNFASLQVLNVTSLYMPGIIQNSTLKLLPIFRAANILI